MIKRVLSFITALCLLFACMSLSVSAEKNESSNKKAKFSGTRSIHFEADASDINNYLNGGRETFAYFLRRNAPNWLSYSMQTKRYTTTLNLQFDFSSLEDYQNKVGELLKRESAIVFEENKDNILLFDDFSTFELLHFVESQMLIDTLWKQTEFQDLFTVSENNITLNGNEYKTDEPYLFIRPGSTETVFLSSINMQTELDDVGHYTRSIQAWVDSEKSTEQNCATLRSRFENAGVLGNNSGDPYYLEVKFEADDIYELTKKTIICLNVSASVTETETTSENMQFLITRTEIIHIDSILSETGKSSITFTCPDSFKSISPVDDEFFQDSDESEQESSITVEGSTVTAENTNTMIFRYLYPFYFEKVEIKTDLRNQFGKVKQSISFISPENTVRSFHDSIKKKLSSKLMRGTKLKIYNQDGYRYYTVSCSNQSIDSVNAFSKEFLSNDYYLEYDTGILPYSSVIIRENCTVGAPFENALPPKNVVAVFVTDDTVKSIYNNDATEKKSEIIFNKAHNQTVELLYYRLKLSQLIIWCLVLLIVVAAAIVILVFVKKFNKRHKKDGTFSGNETSVPTNATDISPQMQTENTENNSLSPQTDDSLPDDEV